MATIREGNRSVLLVVDVQVGVMDECWNSPRVIENVARAVERARAHDVPVIWVQHDEEALAHGSSAWQLVPELTPAEDEVRIYKQFNSSFEQTPLEEELAKLGATQIVLAGAATNWCIRATAYGALERGYDLTLIGDAHTTSEIELDDGTVIEAVDIIQELNAVMAWVSYPGRSNRTVTVEAVDFAGSVYAQASS